jgi:hypothetical protein
LLGRVSVLFEAAKLNERLTLSSADLGYMYACIIMRVYKQFG